MVDLRDRAAETCGYLLRQLALRQDFAYKRPLYWQNPNQTTQSQNSNHELLQQRGKMHKPKTYHKQQKLYA